MFNEDNTVEQMLIEAATQSSWQYVKSQDIPRSSDSDVECKARDIL